MLTQLTQTAIAVLYDIYTGGYPYRTTQYPVAPHCLTELLTRLETGGLIRRKDASADNLLSSYELARPYSGISLLDGECEAFRQRAAAGRSPHPPP